MVPTETNIVCFEDTLVSKVSGLLISALENFCEISELVKFFRTIFIIALKLGQ